MNDNSSEECIICFNKILYPNDQIVLNCFHKLCAECYYRIINDPRLLQKCPICRHDIFDNLTTKIYNENIYLHWYQHRKRCVNYHFLTALTRKTFELVKNFINDDINHHRETTISPFIPK